MKKGDILLTFCWYDPLCWLIRIITNKKWSHTCWVINDKEVISAHGNGITIQSIEDYHWGFSRKLLRFKHPSKVKINKITKYLISQQKRYFHFKFIIDLFKRLSNKKTKRLKSCAWFIADGLQKCGIYIIKDNVKYVCPGDFAESELFKDVTGEI